MKSSLPPKLLAILGPTATGKSDLAVFLAEKFGGEVISADSRQVYRGMDIGTGKITREEMRGVPHHLLDVVDPINHPGGLFSVASYQELASAAIADIQTRNKIPILCGGTGQYLKAVLQNDELPNVPPDAELRQELSTWDTADLFAELERLDPRRAAEIDRDNPRRLIRAIEIAKVLGLVPTVKLKVPGTFNLTKSMIIGLTCYSDELRVRIHARLLARLEAGMLDEVQHLHDAGLSWERLDAFGLEYRYCARHLQGEISYEQMVTKLETEIWRYAKRQMTYFKKYFPETQWFHPAQREEICASVSHFLKPKA